MTARTVRLRLGTLATRELVVLSDLVQGFALDGVRRAPLTTDNRSRRLRFGLFDDSAWPWSNRMECVITFLHHGVRRRLADVKEARRDLVKKPK
jgi:hypothetical protein